MATRPLDLSQERLRGRETGRKEREGRVGVGEGVHPGRRTQKRAEMGEEWRYTQETRRAEQEAEEIQAGKRN